VTTDDTGRASFTAPATGTVILSEGGGNGGSGDSGAGARGEIVQQGVLVASFASVHEPFRFAAGGSRAMPMGITCEINGEPALVMAASPECVSVLPGVKTSAGPAQIVVISPGGTRTATTTLVALESQFPKPPMLPGKKGRIEIRVRGTDQRVPILAINETPDVVRFLRGDAQEVLSSGGAENAVEIEAQAIRSGDFSFRGSLVPPRDDVSAQRYLDVAQPLASFESQRQLKEIAKELARQHHDEEKLRRRLDQIIDRERGEDFRTLAAAARALILGQHDIRQLEERSLDALSRSSPDRETSFVRDDGKNQMRVRRADLLRRVNTQVVFKNANAKRDQFVEGSKDF